MKISDFPLIKKRVLLRNPEAQEDIFQYDMESKKLLRADKNFKSVTSMHFFVEKSTPAE